MPEWCKKNYEADENAGEENEHPLFIQLATARREVDRAKKDWDQHRAGERAASRPKWVKVRDVEVKLQRKRRSYDAANAKNQELGEEIKKLKEESAKQYGIMQQLAQEVQTLEVEMETLAAEGDAEDNTAEENWRYNTVADAAENIWRQLPDDIKNDSRAGTLLYDLKRMVDEHAARVQAERVGNQAPRTPTASQGTGGGYDGAVSAEESEGQQSWLRRPATPVSSLQGATPLGGRGRQDARGRSGKNAGKDSMAKDFPPQSTRASRNPRRDFRT